MFFFVSTYFFIARTSHATDYCNVLSSMFATHASFDHHPTQFSTTKFPNNHSQFDQNVHLAAQDSQTSTVATFNQQHSASNEWNRSMKNSNTTPSTDVILARSLPVELAAPEGWHSEIIESSSSAIIDDGTRTRTFAANDNISTQQEEYRTSNTTDTSSMLFSSSSQVDQFINQLTTSPTQINITNNYQEQSIGDHHAAHEQQTFISQAQQQSLIENIEHQQPPPLIIHKKLPNNQVTYQQNVSLKYLQPPSPPPPGPIIIRK
jgi:hypothetical protein